MVSRLPRMVPPSSWASRNMWCAVTFTAVTLPRVVLRLTRSPYSPLTVMSPLLFSRLTVFTVLFLMSRTTTSPFSTRTNTLVSSSRHAVGTKMVTSARRHVTAPVISFDVRLLSSTLVRHFFTPSSPVTSTLVASSVLILFRKNLLVARLHTRKRICSCAMSWSATSVYVPNSCFSTSSSTCPPTMRITLLSFTSYRGYSVLTGYSTSIL
mmetsp:Transcript_8929/g.22436  ORF Transcript_8929/g.22436 Transcript_8929/m.22436 type:complete len:210 (-) Transcript_8929:528-1157(-)